MQKSVLAFFLLLSFYSFANDKDFDSLKGKEKYKAVCESLEKEKYRGSKKTISYIDSLLVNDEELEDYPYAKVDLIELKGRTLLISAKFDKSVEVLKEALIQSENLNYLKGKGKSTVCLGSVYGILGKDSLAYENLFKGFDYLVELEDSIEIAAGCNHLGLYLKKKGELDQALAFYQRAQLIYEANNDTSGLFKVINNQALIWKNDQYAGNDKTVNMQKAILLFEKAIVLAEQLKNDYYKASVYVNLSGAYTSMSSKEKNKPEDIELFKKSLDYAKRSNALFLKKKIYYQTGPTLIMISASYWNLKQLDSAEYYAKKALDIVKQHKTNYEVEATALETLGLIEIEKGINLDKAEKYSLDGLKVAQEHSLIFKESKVTSNLVTIYVMKGDYKKALFYNIKHNEIIQDLNNEEEFKKLSKLEAGYENKRLLRDKKVNELEYEASLKEKQLWIGITLLLIVLAIVIAILYVKNNRLKSSQLKIAIEKERLSVEREKRLSELDQFKTKFFANISHEFRTPLTLMIGAINELREKDKKDRFLRTLDHQSKQLLSLINQILDLTKFELKENSKLKLAYLDIKEVFMISVASFHSFTEQKDIEIKMTYKGEHKGYINRGSIDKVINNLIFNAIKFSNPKGEIKLDIVSDGQYLKIECFDNGTGIDEKDLPHIFDQYYHSNVGLSTTNGIGLALIKELIKKYYGEIKVESIKDEWTKFYITIPIDKTLIEGRGTSVEIINDTEVISQEPKVNSFQPLPIIQKTNIEESKKQDTILVIDDNEAIRNYLFDILKDQYNVLLEVNGQKGFENAKNTIPDLVISDVMMPEVNGLEMTKLLKNTHQTSHIPIILLTAKADQTSLIEGYQTKAEAYITKPFVKQDLLVRIENILENRKLLQAKFRESFLVKDELVEISDSDEKLVKQLTKVVEDNLDNSELSVEEVAKELFISRSQLHRKIKALTGKSSSVFIRDIRLRYAKELILKSDATISEIAYQTGFNTPTYFSKCFSDLFATSPTQLREKSL